MRNESGSEEARQQDMESVKKHLLPDESLLWMGWPGKRGIKGILNLQFFIILAFSVVWICGVVTGSVSTAIEVISGVMSGESSPSELLLLLIFVPFYLGGCFLIWMDIRAFGVGSHILYALTDSRILVLDVRKKKAKCTAYRLSALSGVQVETEENGVGTIYFSQNGTQSDTNAGSDGTKWDDCFYKIPNVQRVYQMISDGIPK
ncbi:MAG: hypothetical protein ACI3XR_00920 [Eubacteriales bacterium]